MKRVILCPKMVSDFETFLDSVLYYYIMGKIGSEGNISNSKAYLWTRGEAELLICPRDDLAMLYIIL